MWFRGVILSIVVLSAVPSVKIEVWSRGLVAHLGGWSVTLEVYEWPWNVPVEGQCFPPPKITARFKFFGEFVFLPYCYLSGWKKPSIILGLPLWIIVLIDLFRRRLSHVVVKLFPFKFSWRGCVASVLTFIPMFFLSVRLFFSTVSFCMDWALDDGAQYPGMLVCGRLVLASVLFGILVAGRPAVQCCAFFMGRQRLKAGQCSYCAYPIKVPSNRCSECGFQTGGSARLLWRSVAGDNNDAMAETTFAHDDLNRMTKA